MEIQMKFIDLENILDLFNEKIDLRDKKDAVKLNSGTTSIHFNDVCFSYLHLKPILNHVNFTINAGQRVALVGAPGSGKTTIIRLLLRFFDPNSGTIELNGSNIKDVQQNSLRDIIGLVPQDCDLFSGDVMTNITYGMSTTDDKVTDAAKLVDIHDRILDMPDQYSTYVGERGQMLTREERQRLVIARTITKDANILIFDEPTSNLDNIAAAKILRSIKETYSDKKHTVLIATHNLSMAVDCDRILVLHQGEIVESGKHIDLIRLNGVYTRMWQQQPDHDEENICMPGLSGHSINS
uniref:ATP-binding cassette sub-family B member 6, mitochondrial n=1 Tax=Phallusia mammillata TaxID=59560 RepID=A0A6F9D640_9ASCI|nr:ATP-binding cassette sub-family B member 6, mitochondrial [Phallusia mammillata]